MGVIEQIEIKELKKIVGKLRQQLDEIIEEQASNLKILDHVAEKFSLTSQKTDDVDRVVRALEKLTE
jgi:hypothetical protein